MEKVMPYSLEAERALLGGLLLDDSRFEEVKAILDDSDFYETRHFIIFSSMVDLKKRNLPIDPVTVTFALNQTNTLENCGGEIYLYEIANQVASCKNIVSYADIVKERSILRKLIGHSKQAMETMMKKAAEEGLSESEKIELANLIQHSHKFHVINNENYEPK